MSDTIERDDVNVMFLRTADEVREIQRGWARLEELVPPRGRKFYGTFDPRTKEYRVCVQVKEGDDPTSLGLELGVIPGGTYLRERLRGEPPAIYQQIAPTFQKLVKRAASPDQSRPSIEFYRERDEIDLLLPVAD